MEYIFTLKDLRLAKNVSKYEIAAKLGLEAHLYFEIEAGRKKPTIDTLKDLASLYGTSMDFIFHAFYAVGVKYEETEQMLDYALRKSKETDVLFIGNWHRPPFIPAEL